jgi:hypothetical protein
MCRPGADPRRVGGAGAGLRRPRRRRRVAHPGRRRGPHGGVRRGVLRGRHRGRGGVAGLRRVAVEGARRGLRAPGHRGQRRDDQPPRVPRPLAEPRRRRALRPARAHARRHRRGPTCTARSRWARAPPRGEVLRGGLRDDRGAPSPTRPSRASWCRAPTPAWAARMRSRPPALRELALRATHDPHRARAAGVRAASGRRAAHAAVFSPRGGGGGRSRRWPSSSRRRGARPSRCRPRRCPWPSRSSSDRPAPPPSALGTKIALGLVAGGAARDGGVHRGGAAAVAVGVTPARALTRGAQPCEGAKARVSMTPK